MAAVAVLLAAAACLLPPVTALGHVTKVSGLHQVTIGWGEEPAYAGLENFVEVEVREASGKPVDDLGDDAAVEVTFEDERISLPLVPGEEPGEFRATIVPTRPGTYSFRVTGRADDETVEATASCSEATFDCVVSQAEVQFPVQDPSTGEIAERLDQELSRDEGDGGGDSALSIVALIASLLALGAVGWLTMRSPRN